MVQLSLKKDRNKRTASNTFDISPLFSLVGFFFSLTADSLHVAKFMGANHIRILYLIGSMMGKELIFTF